jgi:DNA-binding sugar fermentation-stimulating protein
MKETWARRVFNSYQPKKKVMRLEGGFLWARFVGRKNWFSADVDLNVEPIDCFMANPGRLKEALISRRSLLVKKAFGVRKMGFDVVGACISERIVHLDTRFVNALVEESLEN